MKNSNLVVSSRNRTLGIILIVAPFLVIIINLFLFAIVNAILSGDSYLQASSNYPGSSRALILNIINFILVFIGLLATIGIFVGIPLGIYFLVKRDKLLGASFDKRSGEGSNSVIPDEIKGWNWGAAGLTWIWGLSNSVWVSLVSLLPFLDLFFWIILGINGNEWAWRKTKWESVQEFQKTQNKWKPWGVAFLIIRFLPLALVILVSLFSPLIWQPRYNIPSSFKNNVYQYREQTVVGSKVKYKVNYNSSRWDVMNTATKEAFEYQFTHKDGDVYAMVIPERIQVSIDTLLELAQENAKKEMPDFKILFEGKTTIQDKEFSVLKMQGTIDGIPLVYYGYYYSGAEGSIQFVTSTYQNLFQQYEGDMKDLLEGLRIT